jgi:Tol biopolymer transport system component
MDSTHMINAVAATLTVGVVLAVGFATAAPAGNGASHGPTVQDWNATHTPGEAMNRYHLGSYSPRTAAPRIAVSLFPEATGNVADIYTMNSRGGDFRRLTKGPGWAAFPSWSPDGTLIAYDWTRHPNGARRDAASGIYVMNPDGSGRRLLATAPWTVPAWSPDGSKIAFWRYDGIYLVGRDGRGLHLIKRNAAAPYWSPDGKKIAYTKVGGADSGIYVMNADGTGQHMLARGDFPAWSPDGKTIAFHSTTQTTNHTNPVWIMNADGSNKRPLNIRTWVDCALAWSPGRQLAVANPAGLFLVRPLGRSVTRLSGAHICGISWKP